MAGFTPSGLGTNSPNQVSVRTDYNFIGTQVLNEFAVLKPDVENEFIQRFGDQNDIINMLRKMGLKDTSRVSDSTIYRHFEADRLHETIKVATTSAGSANVAHTVNIAAGDVYDIGQASPYLGNLETEAIVPRVNDVVWFENGVQAIVTAVDASTPSFTCIPTQAGENIPAVTDGDEVGIMTNAVKEASGERAPRSSRVIYYENNVQNFREGYTITGDARGEGTWINFDGRNGSGNYWFYKEMPDTFKRHEQAIAQQLIFGNNITNAAVNQVADLRTVKMTKGLVPTIEDSGVVEGYVAGAMTLGDLDSLNSSLLEQQASNHYLFVCDNQFRNDFGKLVRNGDGTDFIQDSRSSIIFRQFNGGVQAVDFDLDVFKYGGFTYATSVQRAFHDPKQLGIFPKYKNFAIGMPIGEVDIYRELGATPTRVPTAQVVYKADGMGGDRRLIDNIRTIQQDGVDAIRHDLLTTCGLETFAINHSVVFSGDES